MQWLAGAKHHQLRRFAAGTYDMSLRLVVLQVVFSLTPWCILMPQPGNPMMTAYKKALDEVKNHVMTELKTSARCAMGVDCDASCQ